MRRKHTLFYMTSIVIVVATTIFYNVEKNRNNTDFTKTILNENIEALSDSEDGDSNYSICYHESVVKKGYTYYDCGDCKKVYDEKGRGSYSKCFH